MLDAMLSYATGAKLASFLSRPEMAATAAAAAISVAGRHAPCL